MGGFADKKVILLGGFADKKVILLGGLQIKRLFCAYFLPKKSLSFLGNFY